MDKHAGVVALLARDAPWLARPRICADGLAPGTPYAGILVTAAALDAVRSWRFEAPQAPEVPDRLFAYAVVAFRTPLAPGTRRQQ